MPIKDGDKVKVHYRGTLDDGSEFDSSRGREPLEFTLGQGMLIPGFEKAVTGLEKGGKVTVTIPPAEAYGEHEPGHIIPIERAQFPEEMELEIGMVIQLQAPDGGIIDAAICEIGDDKVMLDANHPLAGKALTFEIEVVEIN